MKTWVVCGTIASVAPMSMWLTFTALFSGADPSVAFAPVALWALAPVAALIMFIAALGSTLRARQRAWVITGTVAGFVPIAGWLVFAPEWPVVHLDSRVSLLLCIVAPIVAAIAFLFLVINALIARRSGLERR